MSMCSAINRDCTLDRSNFFLNLGVDEPAWESTNFNIHFIVPLCRETQLLLEQLERLRSVDTAPPPPPQRLTHPTPTPTHPTPTHPPPTPTHPQPQPRHPWLLLIHIESQVKTRQSEVYKFWGICQKFKFFKFEKKYDTSEVAWKNA